MASTISEIWKIKAAAAGFAAQTFASLNISDLEIEKLSQTADTAKFRQNGPSTAVYLWAYKTVCTITKNGANWFSGRRVNPIPEMTGLAEFIDYILYGPWWDLEQICYMQESNFYNGNDDDPAPEQLVTPIVLLGYELGQNGSGTYLSSGQQITNILNYAAACGANLQVGIIDPGIIFPISEEKGKTCAELIKQVMRITPDAVLQFDHSTSPPTANLTRRANGSVVTLGLSSTQFDSIKLTPRYDLQYIAVCLYYLSTNQVGENNWVTQTSDIWPLNGIPNQIGALVAALQLAGTRVNSQMAPLATEPIPNPASASYGGTAADSDVIAWFQTHCRKLQPLTVENMSIAQWGGSSSWEMDIDPNQVDLNGNAINFPNNDLVDGATGGADGGALTTPGQLPRALLHGNIPPWKVAPAKSNVSADYPQGQTTPTDGYLHAAMCTVKVLLTYNFQADSISDEELLAAVNVFGGQALADNSASVWFYARVKATDAQGPGYPKPVDGTYAEPTPVGLAKYLYDSLSVLHQEGEVPYTLKECDGAVQVSDQLNITGGRSDWASMLGQVQRVTEKIDTGQTIATIGPPKHLSPSELLDLLRYWRDINTTKRIEERNTGTANDTTDSNDGVGMTSLRVEADGDQAPIDIPPFQPQDNGDGTVTLPQTSYLFDTDEETSLTISNLTTAITATIGQFVYLQIPITSDQDVDPSGTISIENQSSWPSNFPISLDTSDPSFIFQNFLYVKILSFVSPSTTGNAILMVNNSGTIVKVIQHQKKSIQLKSALVNNDSTWGLIALDTDKQPDADDDDDDDDGGDD